VGDERVVEVRAGGWHSALITSAGRVLTFGLGDTYRLGHGTEEDLRTPKVVEGFVGIDVVCGGAHTLILSNFPNDHLNDDRKARQPTPYNRI